MNDHPPHRPLDARLGFGGARWRICCSRGHGDVDEPLTIAEPDGDATVASAEIRVLEARLSACRRDAQEARQRHRQALAAMNLELGALRDKNESDRRDLMMRLRDESLIVNELTKRCDALTRELRGTDVSPLSATAKASLRTSREAARTLVVSPDEVDPTPRARGAFSELLDSNAALLQELGVG